VYELSSVELSVSSTSLLLPPDLDRCDGALGQCPLSVLATTEEACRWTP